MCQPCAPYSSKQSQMQHVNFIMYVSYGSKMHTFKVTQINSAVHMGSTQENVHSLTTVEHNDIKVK